MCQNDAKPYVTVYISGCGVLPTRAIFFVNEEVTVFLQVYLIK
jgi:hypothetical protein